MIFDENIAKVHRKIYFRFKYGKIRFSFILTVHETVFVYDKKYFFNWKEHLKDHFDFT